MLRRYIARLAFVCTVCAVCAVCSGCASWISYKGGKTLLVTIGPAFFVQVDREIESGTKIEVGREASPDTDESAQPE